MNHTCPPSCMALSHPEAGFFLHNCQAGETFTIEAGHQHQIIFLLYGEAVLNSEERHDYHISEGSFFFCYSGYHYELQSLGSVTLLGAYFTTLGAACDLTTLTQLHKRQRSFRYEFTTTPFNEPLREFLHVMHRYLEDGIACKHLHYAAIQQLFVIFRFYYKPKTLLRLFYNLLNNDLSFRTLVQNNCAKAKTLNELAALCGYEISVFNVLFRKHFQGITPYAWMQEQRSHEIRKVICESDLSIGEIAARYGFSNPGHLSSFCRKFFGCTPTQLRAGHKTTEEQA
ncbi:MAG: helix-turn-helix transcriptional regulator [Alistipes sp.]|nr:helix-turn-helix transcriptional regulator [Alistipes sp.]